MDRDKVVFIAVGDLWDAAACIAGANVTICDRVLPTLARLAKMRQAAETLAKASDLLNQAWNILEPNLPKEVRNGESEEVVGGGPAGSNDSGGSMVPG